MNSNQVKKIVYTSIGALILVIGSITFAMWPVIHEAKGSSQRGFTLNVEFDKFRQIMVRKNATEAIVANSGMKVLSEKVNDLSIQIPQQKRRLLKAALGKSQASLAATKQLTVSLENPELDAKKLNLMQYAQVEPESMDVTTESIEPAGNLLEYLTHLHASKAEAGTKVELAIDQTVKVTLPRFFVSVADQKVQKAAVESIVDQERAIRDFIAQYQNDPIVLPDLH